METKYVEPISSKSQCGFKKGFSAQHCVSTILEKWESTADDKRNFGALFTDLSKAFNCLSHDLLLAKLNAFGLSIKTGIKTSTRIYIK